MHIRDPTQPLAPGARSGRAGGAARAARLGIGRFHAVTKLLLSASRISRPMRHLVLLSLLCALVAAGCASPAAVDAPEPDAVDGAAAPLPRAASHVREDEPGAPAGGPLWSVGDWWTWEVSSDLHAPYEVTTVVAAFDGAAYHVGVTDLEAGLRSVWFHAPPLGLVDAASLAWEMHDAPADLVELPLEDGKVWGGMLEGALVAFHAEAQEDGYAVVGTYENERTAVTYTWSPAARNFEHISLHYGAEVAWGSARLVDYGSGHASPVHVIDADDALLAGAGVPWAPTPPGEFDVPASATHVVLGCRLVGGPGVMGIAFLPPDDAEPLACAHPAAGVERSGAMVVLSVPAREGEWKVVYAPAGQGYVSTEVSSVRVTETTPSSG